MKGATGQTLSSGMCFQYIYTGANISKLCMWFACGSREESVCEYGITHLAEHCIHNLLQEKLMDTGATVSAQVSYDYVFLEVTALNKEMKTVIKIISQCFMEPLVSLDRMENEKKRILEECNVRETNQDAKEADLLYEIIWKDQLNHSPVGKKEQINEFTQEQVHITLKKILSSRMVVAYMGNISYEEILSMLNSVKLQKPVREAKEKRKEAHFVSTKREIFRAKESETDYLYWMLMPLKKIEGANYAKFVFYSIAMAGYSKAVLPEKICYEKPLAYYIKSETVGHRFESLLKISAIVNHSKAMEIEKYLEEILLNINLLSEDIYTQTKIVMESYMQEMLHSPNMLMKFAGNILINNPGLKADKAMDMVVRCTEQISYDDIVDFYNSYISKCKISRVSFRR